MKRKFIHNEYLQFTRSRQCNVILTSECVRRESLASGERDAARALHTDATRPRPRCTLHATRYIARSSQPTILQILTASGLERV